MTLSNALRFVAFLAILCGAHAGRAAASETFESRVEALIARFKAVPFGRYMESECQPIEISRWKGFPTQKCIYSASGKIPLPVAMLNPSKERLARWIVSACNAIQARNALTCESIIWTHIANQSGAQFPIAGLVDESFSKTCKNICFIAFRDGVAVELAALDNFPNQWRHGRRSLKNFDLSAPDHWDWLTSEKYTNPGFYGRIASTTSVQLDDWIKLHPEDSPPENVGNQFPDLLAHYYKKAWSSDRNILIDAWANASASRLTGLPSNSRSRRRPK